MAGCIALRSVTLFVLVASGTSVSTFVPVPSLRKPVKALVDVHGVHAAVDELRSGKGSRSAQPEQLETWKDSQKAAQSIMEPAELDSLSAGITAESFKAQLKAIVDVTPSRFIGKAGNGKSASMIKKALGDLGMKTETQALTIDAGLAKYVHSTTPGGNVIGFMKGTDKSDEVVLVACHYDSVNWRDTTADAPGVDDNGSGVALMLELAKAFAHSTTRPRRSLLFVAFNAEEEGLQGSQQFAAIFEAGGDGVHRFGKPVAAIVADEVAWPGEQGKSRSVIFETRGNGICDTCAGTTAIVDTFAHAAKEHGKADGLQDFVVNYHGFGSDHMSLLNAGIPAVLLIERDNMHHADMWGHSAEDTFKHIDVGFGAAVTRLALRTVAALAAPK